MKERNLLTKTEETINNATVKATNNNEDWLLKACNEATTWVNYLLNV